jgi:hypothetical protein
MKGALAKRDLASANPPPTLLARTDEVIDRGRHARTRYRSVHDKL